MLAKIWKDPVASKLISIAIISGVVYIYDMFSPLEILQINVMLPVWVIFVFSTLFLVALIFAIWGTGIKRKENDYDLGTRSGVLNFGDSLCEYEYNIWSKNLLDYKMKCKNCKLRMEPVKTSAYDIVPRFKFVCTECGSETKDYEMSQGEFFKEIEKRAERTFENA
ncbi:hypothetical protein [Trichloromonas acetexigens]|uniref:Uncharacterized protein n=1 Tax=Trichloromonas acetexigens TaxID=38815 RepID=A0A550JLK8_9BACT|nr:hypothetical protein [Desulfuromonas acetexigens]TRO84101.1 hypothetical protein FL622_02670 [Desulfuromonas acetexigens]